MPHQPGRPDLGDQEPFPQLQDHASPATNSWEIKDFGPPTTPWPRLERDPLRRWSYLRCCFRVHP